MRKLWCLEGEKNWRENSGEISFFFLLLEKWEGMKYLKGREREKKIKANQEQPHQPSTCGPRVAHVDRGLSGPCVTRGSHVDNKLGLLALLVPLALRSRSSAVSGPPNSDFESIFGLQIMTPSRTTKTMKL
jgi:hypothetical protein